MENNEDEVENEDNGETNEEQIKEVYDALFEAIPDGICSFNVLIAINQLSLDWAMELHEECHFSDDEEDDGNDSPIGRLSGTPFSKS
jgi:hypothetical protein